VGAFRARAVEDWREGDRLVTELAAFGEELRQAVAAGAAGTARRDRLLAEIDALDGQISAREASFARHMGEAARAMRQLVMIGLLLGSLALWAVGLRLSCQAFRRGVTAERRFAASEERFRDFANVASDWFWETDAQHRFTYLSGRAMAASDGARAASLGRTPLEVVGADPDSEAWRRHMADIKARRPFRDFSFPYRRRDGKERFWSISGTPVYDAAGAFTGYRGTGTDVTRERLAQQALHQAKEQAESASRAKSEFVANISHELRTPLNAILGFAEIIRDRLLGPIGDPRYAEYARDIHTSGSHLLGIINDILDLSKVEAGRLELIEEIVDVQNIVKGVALLLRQRVAAGGLQLKVDLPDKMLLLRADERKLKQILMNLLSNAVKFTPVGGEITIRVRVEPERALILEVIDTGIGIAAKDIVRALSPFGQIDTRMSRRYEGTGLGLPLAKALAELHGGKLALESTLGQGTTVRITLPAERLVEHDMRRWAHADSEASS
jgi:PAS domain S-box-containing protein